MIDGADLDNRFMHHPPRDDRTVDAYTQIRGKGRQFADLINELVPDSREKSLAITKLEEVVMWANAGRARNDD